MNLEEFRQKFPQYNEYDDGQLANALYKRHYSDKLEFGDFAQRIGYTPPEAVAPKAPLAPPSSEAFPLLRQAADVPLKVGAGAVTGIRMIADAFGADSSVGKNLRGVEDYIADLYSAQSKKDSQEIGRIMKDAEDKGALDQVLAGVKAFSVAPVDMLANALGTAAPAIAAGLATTLGGAPALAANAARLGIGAVMGAGTVKGAIYDATKEALKANTDLSEKDIEARAVTAQEYNGKNLDQILIGAGLGAVGSSTAVEPILARQLAKGITSKESVREAIKQAAAKDTALAAERGVLKQGAITGGKELLTEGAQGGQEQLAQNIALQREGFNVPTMRGVYGQATMEGLAGLGMGAVTGGRESASATRELAGEKTLGQTEEQQKTSDAALKDQFTSAQEQARKAGKGFDQATADMLMPASDAAGKALVEGVIRPDVTEIPAVVETKAKKAKVEPIKPEAVTPESLQAADDYIAKIDGGETIKQSDYRKVATTLGVTIPFGTKNVDGVEIIRQHLAQRGAPDATGLNVDTSGAGAEVAALAPANQTAAGPSGPQPGGVVSTGTTIGPDLAGAGQQPAPLRSALMAQLDTLTEESSALTDKILMLGTLGREGEVLGADGKPLALDKNGEYDSYKARNAINTLQAELDKSTAKFNNLIKQVDELDAAGATQQSPTLTQGAPSGTTTPQTQQTTSQGQAGPAAGTAVTKPAIGSVSLGDLTPELQDQVLTRQNAIYDMEAEGANTSKIAAAYKGLNTLEESLGLELTKPSTLSAKKDNRFVDVRKDILGEGKQAIATNPDITPAYEGQDLEGAMKTGAKYENEAEAERDRAYQESLNKSEASYRAEQDLQQTEAEKEAGITLKSGVVSQENRDNYDRVREEFTDLPEWKKLDSVDKDVYFENIRYGNMPEHRKAAQALITHLKETGGRDKGYGQGTTPAGEQRAIKSYGDGRGTSSKLFGIQFPRWSDLSQAAQDIFLSELGKGQGRSMNLAGAQQDVAFAKVGEALKIEQSGASSAQKQKELDNIKQRQEEVRKEAEENKTKLDKLKADFNRLVASGVPGTYLPNSIAQMVKGNNLRGVLQFLRDKYEINSAKDKIFKSVAQALFEMKLDTKIRYVNSLPNGDLAQYDSVTDTISVTAQGMTAATVLHEIVHAATAKIVNLYTTRQFKQLTEAQIRAVEHLNDLMNETAETLAVNYPNAFEVVGKNADGTPRYSLMEFLAYSLTNENLQIDLATLQPKRSEVVVTNLPESKSMWSELGRTIAKIIGLDKVYFRKNKTREDAPYNYLLEISSSFNEILAKPTEPIFLSPFSAKNTPPLTATDKVEPKGLDPNAKEYELSEKENPTKKSQTLYKTLTTREGWRTVTKNVQDRGYFSSSLSNKLDRADMINRDKTGKFTNFEEERVLSVGKAKNYVTAELQKPMDDLRATFQAYLKASGYKFEQAMSLLQQISEMRHEPERRHVNFVLGVPLKAATKDLIHNGKPISGAQRRIDIVGDPRTGVPGLIHKVELTKAQQTALFKELEYLANNYADPLGDTPRAESYEKIKKQYDLQGSKAKGYSIDENNRIYNALGLDKVDIDKRLEDYAQIPAAQRVLIEQMFAEAKVISDATMKMDKIGNYWSTPVSNLVGMYNYQNYMPFKGISKTLVDDMSDPNSEINGADLQDTPHSADGRFTVADNPFLRLLNDAYRSAGRAGRKDYTQAIYNAVEAGLIPGKIEPNIKFEQRNVTNLSKYKGANSTYIFHYNENGSIDIIKINDLKVLRALRYSFRDASPMLEMANAVTGFFGAMHTRYNYNFAPLNFVRDALTNAWNIGASRQLGPAKSLSYLSNIAIQVTKNGLGKAMEVALLHEKGDPESRRILSQRAKNDPYTRDLLEYLRFGGKTVYMESFSLSSNLEALNKGLNRSRIVATYEGFTKLIDSWNNMFEFSSRAVAFSMYKKEALNKNIAKGMSNKPGPEGQLSPAEEAAATEASAWVKSLANFEKVGEYGRELGAAYMFIRPSATGAVRAVEAILPAFTTEAQERADLPPQIAKDEAAVERYMENFRKERKNAQQMMTALIGGGMFLWTMSMLMSPDDDWRRNSTRSDNMQQWTRFARFHIPDEVSEQLGLGKDVVFQIPWGFGLGSFAAIGAQICAIGFGNTTFKEGMGNILTSILADSYLPLPISKIEVTESPMKWAVDSIMPTVLRPVTEYLMNTNGVGQAINSSSTRRLGEAFTGGDRIPEVYKTLSTEMYRQSLGSINMSPNTLYFFTNSYLDGVSKMFLELPYSLTDLAQGEKTFNPKTDVPLFGSFFGAKTNVDSREYGKMEIKVKDMSQRLTTLESDSPELYGEYISKNPLVPKIVDIYQERQGDLNDLRQKATEIRTMRQLSPKDRDSLLKITIMQQNFLKHMMVEDFKAYGLDR